MIRLVERMPQALAATIMVQEQLGLALNRAGKAEEAERVLRALIAARGPSSETYGILGRVYKDRWEAAAKAGRAQRRRVLAKAVDAYSRASKRLARRLPGINAVTLMERASRRTAAPRAATGRTYASSAGGGGRAGYWDTPRCSSGVLLRTTRRKRRRPSAMRWPTCASLRARVDGAQPPAHPRDPRAARRGRRLIAELEGSHPPNA